MAKVKSKVKSRARRNYETAAEIGRRDNKTWVTGSNFRLELSPAPRSYTTTGGVTKAARYRGDAADAPDDPESSSESSEDDSGEFSPGSSAQPGVGSYVHRLGERKLPFRPSDTPLHTFSPAKEISTRLAKASTDHLSVYPIPVFFSSAKSKQALTTMVDPEFGATEDDAIQFVKKSTSKLVLILMTPEAGKRNGPPTINSPGRHAWILLVIKDGKKYKFLVWDPDTPQFLRDMTKEGKEEIEKAKNGGKLPIKPQKDTQFAFYHMGISYKRLIKGIAGQDLRFASKMWIGGYGNYGQEQCLELCRQAIMRAAEGAGRGIETGFDLGLEHMVDLPFVKG